MNLLPRALIAWSLLSGAPLVGFDVAVAQDKTNTGQDPTRPMTRFDLRLEDNFLPFDGQGRLEDEDKVNTLILRADAPIPLGKQGKQGTFYFRIDIPLISVQRTSDNPGSFELGSTYLQFIHIAPKSWGNLPGGDGWGWGYAMQAPTSTNGRQKRSDIAAFASKWNLKLGPNDPGGSFIVPLLRYFRGDADVENGFDAINQLSVLPTINFKITKGIDFVTLWGNYEWLYNFEDGEFSGKESGDYFIPYDVTVGKMLSGNKVVLSFTAAGKLLSQGDFVEYDRKYMLRLGFFF